MEAAIQTRGLLSLPTKPIGVRSLLQPSHGLKQRLFAAKPRNLPGFSLSFNGHKKFQTFEPTLHGISISHKERSSEFICKAEAAAAGDGAVFGEGDSAAVVASPKIFGVEVATLKKIIPLGLMFFCILFNYTILRDTKDVLVVTAKGSSAEIIPFLKTWVNLPMAIGFMLLYTKLSNVLSKKALFYTVIIPFIVYFGAFGFVMYPLSNYIHPEALADKLLATLGPRFMGPLAILRIWSFCLFYVMAELWGSVVISVLFWGFANQITTVDEAKKFYPLFGLGANVALIFSGRTVKYFSNLRRNLGPGVDGWAVSLKAMMSIVVGMGLAICFLYWWVNRYVPLPTRSKKKKEKPKMGTMESLKFLVSSPYIRDLATLVVAYGISINLVEVTWKSKLKAQFPSPNEYSAFMGDFSTCTGIATFTMMLLSQYVFDKYGWGVAAKITPTVLLLTGVAFFSLILFGGPFAPLVAKLGMTPLLAAVYVGALQNIFSKSAKYSLFDPCKEMAYIPLDEDTKVKGKAAIDVVCNPLGKSGGALIQQFMILSFGSLANSTPYLGMILLVIVTAWLAAAKSLEGQFNSLRSEEELEKEMERASLVKIPVVSQDESGNGSLGESPSSSPEKSAPTNL
ncbi:chloroplast ADP, ATP carrier protein 1 [Arabidopsis lyrata subsp. lyrata]|uniref:ADP,ATP carrier protein n=1 Tax=Arabidopsis lyrata subsp. lyrata TaxID=81972 RepID=D7KX72_ARALL|nr:ADP,ATP carrier protein 1, chloroplastic [Arabidopsis lyrata subsp. lyrata]EFH65558.1 chloroplast ADP, ATP carrier protein 1 [Arabidopsis lyrata subsp. lyrata]|eukprot:XP_020891379.1 ADP,ATP carrier protein 1, chloroplastic [Arabidopsis lyrata subsp. lyrata]